MKHEKKQPNSFLIIKGFCMGTADLVPGVSGGTVALLLGVYERLIGSISDTTKVTFPLLRQKKLKQAFFSIDWQFFFALGSGILAAILLLSGPITYALEHHHSAVMALFLGLVLASVWVLRKRVSWGHSRYNALVIGTIFAYWLTGFMPGASSTHPLAFFVAGAIAISAMILPGISGSFLLVIMGKYEQVLSAVHMRDVDTIAIFGAGVLVGILLFSRVVHFLLDNYHDVTLATLLGFMLGASRALWPWQIGEQNVFPTNFEPQMLYTIALIFFGFIFVFFVEKQTKGKYNSAAPEKLT